MRRNSPYIVAILAIAASITGVMNGFALDDVHLIATNERLHSLSGALRIFTQSYWPPEEGSSLYRPFTSLAFLLQWVMGSGSPLPFHIVSIALYAAVSVAVFRFALELVEWKVALIAAALFAVHPLHVEAVANVVGQAELWAALFALLALIRYVAKSKAGTYSTRDSVLICLLYGVALMFKEHVIVLPAIIMAAELLIVGGTATSKGRLRERFPLLISMALVGLSFMILRTSVIGRLEGAGVSPAFVGESYATRVFTMLRVVSEWIRLFFWPATLSADYSPSRIPVATGFEPDMVPGLLVIVGVAALAVKVRRSLPVITFAICFVAILLLIPSNLIVVTGFVLAERTLFLASAGVAIAVSVTGKLIFDYLVAQNDAPERERKLVLVAIALVVIAGIGRSSTRNPAWKNNDSLIQQTVLDAPTSARAHMMMAQLESDRGRRRTALEHTVMALRLGPEKDQQLYAFAADMFQMAGNCSVASGLYAHSLAIDPRQPQVRINAHICLSKLGMTSHSQVPVLAAK